MCSPLLGGLVAGFTITAIVRMGKAAFDTGDQLRDLSLQTGVSVEALQPFQRLAELSGSSAEALRPTAYFGCGNFTMRSLGPGVVNWLTALSTPSLRPLLSVEVTL
jgi:hypothetical protein